MSKDLATKFSFRYLKGRHKESFISIITIISILSVAISVMVLNIVMSIMTGFQAELQAKLVSSNPHILIRPYVKSMPEWKAIAREVEKVPGVVSSYPYSIAQVMLSHNSQSKGLLVRAIPRSDIAQEKLKKFISEDTDINSMLENQLSENPNGTTTSYPPLVVGKALSRDLGLSKGSIVTIFTSEFSSGPTGLTPKFRRFIVSGIYSSGLSEYESGLVFTNIAALESFYGKGNVITGLEASVAEVYKAKSTAEDISEHLKSKGLVYSVIDWTKPNQALWDALKLEKRVYYIVLLLLILIASFSIVSTMVMIVMEKTKDIATLKVLGSKNRMIMKIFLYQGMVVGFIGTLLGTVLGFLGCLILREYGFELDEQLFSLTQVPVKMEPQNFILVAISALIITSLSGVYPSRKAAKIDPAKALRFDS